MTEIGSRIHTFIDGDDAVEAVEKYYGGRYTGSRFDAAPQLQSPDPHRITAHDIAAVATLSVELQGRAVVGLIDRDDELSELLRRVPDDIDLADTTDADLETIFSVQRLLDRIDGIGHVTRSKLLAHKRPRLVPIRDQYVLTALIGQSHGPFTRPLRDALAADHTIDERLEMIRTAAQLPVQISTLRTLDVVIWMAKHGNAQVTV